MNDRMVCSSPVAPTAHIPPPGIGASAAMDACPGAGSGAGAQPSPVQRRA